MNTLKNFNKGENMKIVLTLLVCLMIPFSSYAGVQVTEKNFAAAETEHFMQGWVDRGGDNKFVHMRDLTPLDQQTVPRMQADTLYSVAIVDASKPVKLHMPDSGGLYQSAQIFDGEHYTQEIIVGKGDYTINFPTTYGAILIRTHVTDPEDPATLERARKLQDQVIIKTGGTPFKQSADYDQKSLTKMHDKMMARSANYKNSDGMFESREATKDNMKHMVGVATGWGGITSSHVVYHLSPTFKTTECRSVTFSQPKIKYFWSFTMYNNKGYMFDKKRNISSTTAKPNEDGTYTVYFGDCDNVKGVKNHLPTIPHWNYTFRTYGPGKEVSNGTWKAPINPVLVK